MDPLKTGKIISEARKKQKLTQQELADKLFISDKAVSKWERGLCFPDISLLIPLTEILKINLYDLLKGEKMTKKDIEETLKNTINYSTNEIKKNKRKYLLISIATIIIVIITSTIIIYNNRTSPTGGTIDRDELHQIDYYLDYKTTLETENTIMIETILNRLPLAWINKSFIINKNSLTIKYEPSIKEIVKAYNDSEYVKIALVNNVIILFTTVEDLNIVKIDFADYSYQFKKNDIVSLLEIENISKLEDINVFLEKVSKKLESKSFVEQVISSSVVKN